MHKILHAISILWLVVGVAAGQNPSTQSGQGASNPTTGPMYSGSQASHPRTSDRMQARIVKEVRHELVMLPYYGVFDNLAYRVDGDTVTLLGQVTRPTLKSDAESVVKKIEGVEHVNNQIQVLPPSPNDDRIRLAVYRAIYGENGLFQYGLAAVPAIHIIVNGGRVALEGVVNNEGDKNLANLKANQVPGVFSVTNNLQVENRQ